MVDNSRATGRSGKPRILIVGGIAGGASCAARARRISEDADILIFERGNHVSFASCGLPYYVGNVIAEEKDLFVATPELFKRRFEIQVNLGNEVYEIDRDRQEIGVRDIQTNQARREDYDALVLSPGSVPIRPSIPGINMPGIFILRTLGDSRQIKHWIAAAKVEKAVVIGGGFIGLEITENLVRLGLSVIIIELLPQIMPTVDPEIAVLLERHLVANDVSVHTENAVVRFDNGPAGNGIIVRTRSGESFDCGMVILAAGVRPEISLAQQAGLAIGALGGIRVDEQMRTSDKRIWAVGDAVEVRNFITGNWSLVALAGPASRQGRIAADSILGRQVRFRGVQGTMVCKVFGMTVAATGATEKALSSVKEKPFEKVYLHPAHHASFYPGAKSMTMKLMFSPIDSKILGAQAIGEEGVEKRIDVISMAIQKGATIYDLEEAEMSYAPQFGSAKDPVNMAGMVAANVLRGDSPVAHWKDINRSENFILDVREPTEFAAGHFEGAINIPLPSLRNRLAELPRDKEIRVYCGVGQRSYYATRILRQNGFRAKNISGGMTTFKAQSQVKDSASITR